MPEISVIVPVYKVESCIRRCVDSILAQTFTDFELILVDDGSPDNSGTVCDEYARRDGRVHVIHKPNGGVSSARNAGIEAAKGNWITFIDSDDYVSETYLDDLYEPEYDLTITGHLHHDFRTDSFVEKSLFPMSCPEMTKQVFCEVIDHNGKYWLLFCWGRLYKAACMKQNSLRFDETLTVGEDYVFSVQYLSFCHSLKMKDSLSYRHIDYGTGTLSKTFNVEFFESMLRAEKTVNQIIFAAYGIPCFGKTEDEIIMVFTDSLCHITSSPHLSFREKYHILQYLFRSVYFKKGMNNIGKYFGNVSVYYKTVLKFRSPLLTLCVFSIRQISDKFNEV